MPQHSRQRRSFALMIFVFSLLTAQSLRADTRDPRYPLLPYPRQLEALPGSFMLRDGCTFSTEGFNDSCRRELALFEEELLREGRLHLKNAAAGGALLRLQIRPGIPAEGYRLSIRPSGIELEASSSAGLFYGLNTILQLIPVETHPSGKPAMLPACLISDQPDYAYRGMHVDVSRHFFSIAYLKRFIDRMGRYHLNQLHLHLTDDQGWRIEIKKYPLLTEQGAWRSLNKQDSDCIRLSKQNPDYALDSSHFIHRNGKLLYGGYYTQDQIRDLVRYAALRQVNIIPEIDMPGHMMAAINEHPFLSCQDAGGWGKLFSVPICPCKESTYQFAENVYAEIFRLFPSPYIHLGGDEVDSSSWAHCEGCKVLMKKEGYRYYAQLQGYFIRRMQAFFHAHGKTLIGWDEVLDAGVDSSAVIMYWRSWVPKAPYRAAAQGNRVVMAPGNPLYFDRVPDKSSLQSVYAFQPIPRGMNSREAGKIMGGEACLWSEHIPSEKRMDYMSMPRMTALAEVLWSGGGEMENFQDRLYRHMERWNLEGIHYRLPDLEGFTEQNVFLDSAVLQVHSPLTGLSIHYTTNGQLPTLQDPLLPPSLVVRNSGEIRLAAFSPRGLRGDVYSIHYMKETYAPALQMAGLKAGLSCSYYPGFFDSTALFASKAPQATVVCDSVFVPSLVKAPSFGLSYDGYIRAQEDGIYSFYLTSDDGSRLLIDGKTVVDNDGLHSAQEKSGQVALKAGWHRFRLLFLEGGGGYTLQLKWAKGGDRSRSIAPASLGHE